MMILSQARDRIVNMDNATQITIVGSQIVANLVNEPLAVVLGKYNDECEMLEILVELAYFKSSSVKLFEMPQAKK